jgi:hypothetical protein
MGRFFSLHRLYARKDGLSIALMVAAAQTIAFLGAIPGFLLIQLTADLNERQTRALVLSAPPLFLMSFLILLYFTWRITGTARQRLDEKAKGQSSLNPDLQLNAWREITGLTWRYGIAAILVVFTVNVLPAYFVSIRQGDSGSSFYSAGPRQCWAR